MARNASTFSRLPSMSTGNASAQKSRCADVSAPTGGTAGAPAAASRMAASCLQMWQSSRSAAARATAATTAPCQRVFGDAFVCSTYVYQVETIAGNHQDVVVGCQVKAEDLVTAVESAQTPTATWDTSAHNAMPCPPQPYCSGVGMRVVLYRWRYMDMQRGALPAMSVGAVPLRTSRSTAHSQRGTTHGETPSAPTATALTQSACHERQQQPVPGSQHGTLGRCRPACETRATACVSTGNHHTHPSPHCATHSFEFLNW